MDLPHSCSLRCHQKPNNKQTCNITTSIHSSKIINWFMSCSTQWSSPAGWAALSRCDCPVSPSQHSYCRNLSLICTGSQRSPHESRLSIWKETIMWLLYYSTIKNVKKSCKYSVHQLTRRWLHGWSAWRFCIQTARHQEWPLSPQRSFPPACPVPLLAVQSSPLRDLSGPTEEQENKLTEQNYTKDPHRWKMKGSLVICNIYHRHLKLSWLGHFITSW